MPYIVYRCDLSQENVNAYTQPLRFRAMVLSDKMNVLDDIDLICKPDKNILPSPQNCDAHHIDVNDLKDTDLMFDEFQEQVNEWISTQFLKRRGTMVMVPARGIEEDQTALEIALKRAEGKGIPTDLISNKKKLLTLNVQGFAKEVLGNKAPANDDGYATDILAMNNLRLPVSYLPFYLEKNIPGERILPAFNGALETLKYGVYKKPDLLKKYLEQEFIAQNPIIRDHDNVIEKGTTLYINRPFEDEKRLCYVVDTLTVEGEEYAVVSLVSDKFAYRLSSKTQSAIKDNVRLAKGDLFVVSLKDIPIEAKASKTQMTRKEKGDLELFLKDLDKKKKTRTKIYRAARSYIKNRSDFTLLFNDYAQQGRRRKRQDILFVRSKEFNDMALVASLKRNKAPWVTFKDVKKEMKKFNSVSYQEEWRSYLKARVKVFRP